MAYYYRNPIAPKSMKAIKIYMAFLFVILVAMLGIGIHALLEEERKENFGMGSDKAPIGAFVGLAVLAVLLTGSLLYATWGQ